MGEMDGALKKEYDMRVQMLLKRLDVTIQSFTWSDRIKVSVPSSNQTGSREHD